MATTYYPQDTADTITGITGLAGSGQANFIKQMGTAAIGSATPVAFNMGIQNLFNHAVWILDPSITAGRADGSVTYNFSINVTVANMNITNVAMTMLRMTVSGTTATVAVQLDQATGTLSYATTGVKAGTVTGNLGTFGATDRMGISMRASQSTGMVQAATLEIGLDNGTEEFVAPWTIVPPYSAKRLQPRHVSAAQRAATWMRRRSGIVVPRLWTPADGLP